MSKFNLSRKLFDLEGCDSDESTDSVIYISSDEEESSYWESDCSTDTEQLIARIEKEVTSSPMLIAGRIMTVDTTENDMVAGPSTSKTDTEMTPKLDHRYFDIDRCYAPPRRRPENQKSRFVVRFCQFWSRPYLPRIKKRAQAKTPLWSNQLVGASVPHIIFRTRGPTTI